MRRVAVLMGGISPEHPVSLASGCGILAQLDPDLFTGYPVLISKDNEWVWPTGMESASWTPPDGWGAAMAALVLAETPLEGWTKARFPEFLSLPPADVYFIGLHGIGGEDGRLQGFLEMSGQPYTGSGSLGSALAMDKILSKQLYSLNGIPTAAWVVFDTRGETGSWTPGDVQSAADRVEKEIGLPAVVKHPTGGSSIGVAVARTRDELVTALTEIGNDTPRVLVEAFAAGRESSCGVLEGFDTALSPTEIRPRKGAFFTFEEKYAQGGAEEITPAEFPAAVIDRIQMLARRAHQALRLSVYSRTDFIWVPPSTGSGIGELFALETNNLPGFTATSLLPQQAAHAGLSYRDLVTRVIDQSLKTVR